MQVDHELTESVTARIPQSVKRQAERDARREHRSLGGHIAWIIAQYYGQQPEPREERIVQESLTPQEFMDELFPGFSQWQKQSSPIPESWKLPPEMRGTPVPEEPREERMTNRQRQKANYEAFIRAMAYEAVSPDEEV